MIITILYYGEINHIPNYGFINQLLKIIRDPRVVVVSNYMKYIASLKFNKTNTNDISPDLIKFHEARDYFIYTSHR